MPHTVYYTASTLDGFIATTDHSLDWLLSREQDDDGPMNYQEFIKGVGAIIMGANTYQWIVQHGGDTWSYEVPSWVVTHRAFEPYPGGADIRFTATSASEVHAEAAAAAGDRAIWLVGGGDLVGQFADVGLLDEVLVSIAPVTIGAGKPLLPRHVELKLTELARNGEFACARYQVVPEPAAAS